MDSTDVVSTEANADPGIDIVMSWSPGRGVGVGSGDSAGPDCGRRETDDHSPGSPPLPMKGDRALGKEGLGMPALSSSSRSTVLWSEVDLAIGVVVGNTMPSGSA